MSSGGAAVRVERDGPVFTVLLSRPERRNAVDGPTAAALVGAGAAGGVGAVCGGGVIHT